MTLVRWNPTRQLASMEIDRLNHMFEDFVEGARGWMPAVDIYETSDREFVIKAELPEMKREDINVTFEHNVLTLTGETKRSDIESCPASNRPDVVINNLADLQKLIEVAR